MSELGVRLEDPYCNLFEEKLIMVFKNKLYIGGKWQEASDGGDFEVLNPADESVLTRVSSGTTADAEACVNAAQEAFAGWASLNPRERGEILRKAYDIFMSKIDEIAHLITLENGRPAVTLWEKLAMLQNFFVGMLKKLLGPMGI